jgi:vancomycin resistance protein VanJ
MFSGKMPRARAHQRVVTSSQMQNTGLPAPSGATPDRPPFNWSGLRRGYHAFLTGVSAALCIAASAAYGRRSGAWEAATLFPCLAWATVGLLLLGFGWDRRHRPAGIIALLLWTGFLAAFAEEPRSLLRHAQRPTPEWAAARRRGKALRVVSLNCFLGKPEAAAEAGALDPDVVLLQETPGEQAVRDLARRWFGAEAAVVYPPAPQFADSCIIARGHLLPGSATTVRGYAALAGLRLSSGAEVEVVGLHLHPNPQPRLDLWSRRCWRVQREGHASRQRQLAAVARALGDPAAHGPLILGGDFNEPAGDLAFAALLPGLRDAFGTAGTGWGDTWYNHLPLTRIDQVWVSRHFRPAAVFARQTVHSDHRMVVCDLWLEGAGP